MALSVRECMELSDIELKVIGETRVSIDKALRNTFVRYAEVNHQLKIDNGYLFSLPYHPALKGLARAREVIAKEYEVAGYALQWDHPSWHLAIYLKPEEQKKDSS